MVVVADDFRSGASNAGPDGPLGPEAFPRARFDVTTGRVVHGEEASSAHRPPAEGAAGGPDATAEQRARDEATLDLYAGMLRDSLAAAIPGWVEQCVLQRVAQDRGVELGAAAPGSTNAAGDAGAASSLRLALGSDVCEVAATAGDRAIGDVGPRLTRLLGTDIDQQTTTPLALMREAVVHATDALRSLGVAPVHRDAQDEALHPDDVYALAPAAFADVDEALQEVGLRWGAAKAHVHLARRRDENR